jgi:hypothetical protein
MTRNKKVKQKLKGDGQQIADLERAVHKAKRNAAEHGRAGRRRHPAVRKVINLLGSREVQETAWVSAMLDCERYAARVPITQVTGAVPVDLYRVSTSALGTTSASGVGFVGTCPDSWYHDSLSGFSGGPMGHLKANGGTAFFGYATGAAYAGTSFPAASVTLSPPTAGITGLAVPDISADFDATANLGTEYIMVGCKTSISMVSPPGGQDRYVGEVWAIYSLDAERAPIESAAPSTIESESLKNGSLYRLSKYKITGSGLFVPIEEAVRCPVEGYVLDEGATGELSISPIPLMTGAYEWRRCLAANYQTKVAYPDVAFYVYAASGTSFKVRHTALWQAERYASALVRPERPYSIASAVNTLQNLGLQAAEMMRPGHVGGLNTAVASTLGNASQAPGFLSQLSNNLSGLGNLVSSGSQLAQQIGSAVQTGSDLLSAIHGYGSYRPSPGVPSGWTIGRPPSSLPASSVELLPEETGGSGILGALESGAEEAAEFAPELLSILA